MSNENVLLIQQKKKRETRRLHNGRGTADVGCRYGQVGTVLGVIERHQILKLYRKGGTCSECPDDEEQYFMHWRYMADQREGFGPVAHKTAQKLIARAHPYRSSPARFMYNELIRYRLRIEQLRLEPLQNMTDACARDEGLNSLEEYIAVWDSLHKDVPFSSNPHVWVISYSYLF